MRTSREDQLTHEKRILTEMTKQNDQRQMLIVQAYCDLQPCKCAMLYVWHSFPPIPGLCIYRVECREMENATTVLLSPSPICSPRKEARMISRSEERLKDGILHGEIGHTSPTFGEDAGLHSQSL